MAEGHKACLPMAQNARIPLQKHIPYVKIYKGYDCVTLRAILNDSEESSIKIYRYSHRTGNAINVDESTGVRKQPCQQTFGLFFE